MVLDVTDELVETWTTWKMTKFIHDEVKNRVNRQPQYKFIVELHRLFINIISWLHNGDTKTVYKSVFQYKVRTIHGLS